MKVKPLINPTLVKLKAYNRQNINTKDICRLKVNLKEKEHHLMFSVGHDSSLSLGDKECENVGLVKRVYCINNVNVLNSAD